MQSEMASVQRGTAVFAGGTTRRPFVSARRAGFVIERADGALQAIANDGDQVLWETHPWIPAADFNYVASLVPTSIAADGSGVVLRAQGQATPAAACSRASTSRRTRRSSSLPDWLDP